MVLGKKFAIFGWEWGRNSAPREGQKIPCNLTESPHTWFISSNLQFYRNTILCDQACSGKSFSRCLVEGPHTKYWQEKGDLILKHSYPLNISSNIQFYRNAILCDGAYTGKSFSRCIVKVLHTSYSLNKNNVKLIWK